MLGIETVREHDGPVSMEAVHCDTAGSHTVLVCVPGIFETFEGLLGELHARMLLQFAACDYDLVQALCNQHLIVSAADLTDDPAHEAILLPANIAPIRSLLPEAARSHHHRHATRVLRRWLAVTAGTPEAKPTPRPVFPLDDVNTHRAATAAWARQPRINAMINAEPGLRDKSLEVFGPGLVALQRGHGTYSRYVAGTMQYGHALLTLDMRLLRSGPHTPATDTLAGRMAYLDDAAAYIGQLPDDVTLAAVHLDLPDNDA
ncbi:hypothetical protein AB0B31_11050 [Catellatospora citrea]|uniref:hypothetical protein n=1 Tax=Catellatospora citrea TaxID=53366 RepID=UPI0033F3B70C